MMASFRRLQKGSHIATPVILSSVVQPKGCDVTALVELRYSRTRAEYVNTCIRHNDRLGLRHQQGGHQRRQDGVCVTVEALAT